jgi:hypothetical protein
MPGIAIVTGDGAKINILSKEDFIEYSLKIEKIAKEK